MYINKVSIKNIRSIKEFSMGFPEGKQAGWHVLIGDNGSGKTSILRAIALALIGPEQAAGLRANWNDWLGKHTQVGSIYLEILGSRNQYDDPYYGKPQDWTESPNSIAVARPNEFILENLLEIKFEENFKIVMLKPNSAGNFSTYNWIGFGYFSTGYGPYRRFKGGSEEWTKVFQNPQLAKLAAHLTLFDESVALTETIDWLKNLKFEQLLDAEQKVGDAINYFDEIKELIDSPDFLPGNTQIYEINPKGVTFIDCNDVIISVDQLSDGFRSILSLTLELVRQIINCYRDIEPAFEIFSRNCNGEIYITTQGVVLIDEIDAHLHPTWQTRIGAWFTKYFPNIQFIVTTHSPLVCRACERGSIWRLASPGSDMVSGEITGVDKDRLVFGNVLDAYGTEAFGKNVTRSAEGNEKLDRLAELNNKMTFGKINEEEKTELNKLRKVLTTDDTTDY